MVVLKERAGYEGVRDVNAAHYASRYFQRPATEVMSNIIDFHNDLMMVLIFISIFIVTILTVCLYKYATVFPGGFYLDQTPVSKMNHNGVAEIIFTVVPAFIVYSIAAPSFALLYANNDWITKETDLTVSVTGHQWFWNYEYSLDKLYFDSEWAWRHFFNTYYSLSNYRAGETEPVCHLFENLVLSDVEKSSLFGRIINCHMFILLIDTPDDYDSYMIEEYDVVGTAQFTDSAFKETSGIRK